jgi:hypothetical protein
MLFFLHLNMPSKQSSSKQSSSKQSSSKQSSKVHVHAHMKTSCNGVRYHVRGQVRTAPKSK